MKTRVVGLLVAVLALFCLPAHAATVKGKVLDEKTLEGPNDWAKVEVFKKNDQGNWYLVANTWLSHSNWAFTFSNLSEGVYSFFFSGGGYVSEYYKNTTVAANRTEVPLAADDTLNLGRVLLKPQPVRLTQVDVPSTTVPAGGGKIKVYFDVVNETSNPKSLYVWANVRRGRTIYNSTWVSAEFTSSGRLVEVPANGSVSTNLVINVPAQAPAGFADIYLMAGDGSKWKPIYTYGLAGQFQKVAP